MSVQVDLGIASSLTRWLDVLDLSLFPHILQCEWSVVQSVLLNLSAVAWGFDVFFMLAFKNIS